MMTDWISKPAKLWCVEDLFQGPDDPPPRPGLYAWFFDELPPDVPQIAGLCVDGFHLGYIGIAPARKPSPGRRGSNLRKRLRMHCAGNASGSTLRLTLGCLLAPVLGIELRRVPSSDRLTFGEGEQVLSNWIRQHARIVWHKTECPWDQEADLIHRFAPPLNLDHNDGNPFQTELAHLRRACRADAKGVTPRRVDGAAAQYGISIRSRGYSTDADEDWLRDALANISLWHRGGQRAPHKPLLLLMALGRIQRGEPRLVPYREVESPLRKLLQGFGPSRTAYHPEYPFWRLQNDGLWEIPGGDSLRPRQSNTDPPPTEMRKISGGFPQPVDELLRRRPALVRHLAEQVLREHFPESYWDDLLSATGLSLEEDVEVSGVRDGRKVRKRDSLFRDLILRAYRYECTVCGISIMVDGVSTGLDAAHVHWHSHGGPSSIENGLSMCPLHHRAFDIGILGLSTTRRVLVSTHLHGGEAVEAFIGKFHGRRLPEPQTGGPVHEAFRAWHASNVFRAPARNLRD